VTRHPVAAARVRARAAAEGRALTPVEERSVGSAAWFDSRQEGMRVHAARVGPVAELETSDLDVEVMTGAAWRIVDAMRTPDGRAAG
jgi:hypothetical protein